LLKTQHETVTAYITHVNPLGKRPIRGSGDNALRHMVRIRMGSYFVQMSTLGVPSLLMDCARRRHLRRVGRALSNVNATGYNRCKLVTGTHVLDLDQHGLVYNRFIRDFIVECCKQWRWDITSSRATA